MLLIKNTTLVIFATLLTTQCASAAWREGFHSDNTLHLVGEGKVQGGMPEVQASAMAREAAIMDAMAHWTKYCETQSSADGISTFRVENQKRRKVDCSENSCRARIVIEKNGLRGRCGG